MNVVKKTLLKILLILIILIILAGLFWVGISIYHNFIKSPQGAASMPDKEEAAFTVLIENTGNLVLTNEYEKQGTAYILQGYWELEKKWKYRSSELILDEAVFGKITIKRR